MDPNEPQEKGDYIDPAFPEAQRLAAYAGTIRSRLGATWDVEVLAPDFPNSIRVTLHHPLIHNVALGGDNLSELMTWVERFLACDEFRYIESFPTGVGSAEVVGHIRVAMRHWGWSPREVFEVGHALSNAGLLDWNQLAWLIEAGPLWSRWSTEQSDEVQEIVGLVRRGEEPHSSSKPEPPTWIAPPERQQ